MKAPAFLRRLGADASRYSERLRAIADAQRPVTEDVIRKREGGADG